jgi:hypothetical protein
MTCHTPIAARHFANGLLAAVLTVGATACADSPTPPDPSTLAYAASPAAAEAHARKGIVDIVASDLKLYAPAEIPSGWTTFRLDNRSAATHFVAVEKMPPGKTLADSEAEVLPIFQAGMDLLIAGDVPAALARFGELPAWFFNIVFTGGPGLTAPGGSSEVTVYLEPGTYVLECYVKTPAGQFHSYLGLVTQIVVTDEDNGVAEPAPTMELTVRNDGFTFPSEIRPGHHVVAVHFAEQQTNGNFVGNDVHLVRLSGDTDLNTLSDWMNWTTPSGLATPAPAPFVGGLEEMPAGRTGYIDVVLEPGRYAWVGEVDDAIGKGMLKAFTVPFGRSTGR